MTDIDTATTLNAADFDPPLEGKQVEQVQAAINEAVRREREANVAVIQEQIRQGVQDALIKPVVEKKLTEYASGDIVDVIKDGEWRVGSVNGVEKKLGMVYVHTDRGPVTVASMRNIRPHQS